MIQYDVTIIKRKGSNKKYILRKQKIKHINLSDQIDNLHQHKYHLNTVK